MKSRARSDQLLMNSADDEIRWWWAAAVFLAFGAGSIAGVGIPGIFLGIHIEDFSEGLLEEGAYWFTFIAFFILVITLAKKSRKNYPKLSFWASNSLLGMCAFVFASALSASFLACLILIFPLPMWLKFAGVGCLYLGVLIKYVFHI